MNRAVIYIHGKGGSAEEAEHYIPLFAACDITGFDYQAQSPWEAKVEFSAFFSAVCEKYDSVTLIANSIGAFFAMSSLQDTAIEKAYFISPIVDMEKLICDMMMWANVTEEELCDRKVIETAFGETLSWDYLCYVREHPITWCVPTHILYGENDNLPAYETISKFASRTNVAMTVMKGGEHWFHTEEQMHFLDNWIRQFEG